MTKQYDFRVMDDAGSRYVKIVGMSWDDYEFYRDVQFLEDSLDGNILYRGSLVTSNGEPTDLVLCTEGLDDPLEVVFGYEKDGLIFAYGLVTEDNIYAGGFFFADRRFFEYLMIPQAREVGVWDVDRERYIEDDPDRDWDRWWAMVDALSRAWPHPTHPDIF